jgi:hypothetical protein
MKEIQNTSDTAINFQNKNSEKNRRNLVLKYIRTEIVKASGKSFETILKIPEIQRYQLGLYHVTTSNKAICEALTIPTEAGCRYKAELEKNTYLVTSVDDFQCPFTKEYVKFLSTNPLEFERLTKSNSNQLKMFDDGK